MSLEKHVIELSAKDTVSPALKSISDNAKKAGKAGEDAATGASRATADWGKAAAKVGAGLGVLAGLAIKLGNDSEVSQTRLKQAVDDTGASYDSLSDKIDAAAKAALGLGFDDEDALDALTTITNASGDAEKAITDLGLAEDIARGRGISLGQAANIVAAAEQGRYAALQRLGIQIDANATREEALGALQQKYSGQAEAYAKTNAATWDRLGNTVENQLETIGGALADFQVPLLAIGAAGSIIGPAGDALEAIGGKAKLAEVATSAMSLAMGPVGLVAAAVAAGGALYYLYKSQQDQVDIAQRAADVNRDLTNSLADQATQLEKLGLLSSATGITDFIKRMGEDSATAQLRFEGAQGALNDWFNDGRNADSQLSISDDLFKNIDDYSKSVIDANHDGAVSFAEMQHGADALSHSFRDTTISAGTYSDEVEKLITLATRPDLNGQKIISDIDAINQAVYDQTITVAEGEAKLKDLIDNYGTLYSTVGDVEDGLKDLTKAQQDNLASISELANKGLENARKRLRDLATELGTMPDLLDALQVDSGSASFSIAYTASGITDTAAELDTMTRIIIGNTDALASNSQGLADWATGMLGSADAKGHLNELLASGAITQGEYNNAVAASNEILAANTSIQQSTLEIQAKQAPVLADLASQQAEYVASLADMTGQQQLAALALMDTTTATQAQELVMLAASAAAGELGTEGEAMAGKIITGAAQANPALAAILESMGLINNTDGKISINFPNATNLNDTLVSLQGSIDALVNATYELIVLANPDDAFTDIASVQAALEGIPDETVEVNANLNPFWTGIGSIPDSAGTSYIDVYDRYHPGVNGHYALGGLVGDIDHSAMGRVGRGMSIVGENGPEAVRLPYGSLVTPNHATKYMDKGGGGGVNINGPITVIANDPQAFLRQMRQLATTMERR